MSDEFIHTERITTDVRAVWGVGSALLNLTPCERVVGGEDVLEQLLSEKCYRTRKGATG